MFLILVLYIQFKYKKIIKKIDKIQEWFGNVAALH
jgi:hypothetical protein